MPRILRRPEDGGYYIKGFGDIPYSHITKKDEGGYGVSGYDFIGDPGLRRAAESGDLVEPDLSNPMNVLGVGNIPQAYLRMGESIDPASIRNQYDIFMRSINEAPEWVGGPRPSADMTYDQWIGSPYSPFTKEGAWGNPVTIYGNDPGPSGFKALMHGLTNYALPAFGAAAGLSALAGGAGAAGSSGGGMWENLFGGQSASAASSGASDVFGLGADSYLNSAFDTGSGFLDEAAAGDIFAPNSIGGDWLQNVTYDPSDFGSQLAGEGNGMLDVTEEYPGGGSYDPRQVIPPDVSGLPREGGGGGGGGVPEWVQKVAVSLGTSPAVLGRILGGVAGGASQVYAGNQQRDVAQAQMQMGAPSRARFEAMSASPGTWAKSNIKGLTDAAADTLAARWSMREGNPADSPRAIRSTERDLAQLMFEAEQSEKQLQAQAGGLTRFAPDAPFGAINAARDLRGQGVTGALGTILQSLFGNTQQPKTTQQIIADLLKQYPDLFKVS